MLLLIAGLHQSAHAEPPRSPARVAAVIVEFPGVESGLSIATVQQSLFGSDGVSERYLKISNGNYKLVPWEAESPAVFGPIVIQRMKNESCDSSYRIWSARAFDFLGGLGKKLDKVDHLVFMFPPAELLGCTVRARGELLGYRTWIFSYDINTILHEIGHNLGLAHAASGSASSVDIEYGDRSSPMGFPARGQLFMNAAEMRQLGWLPPSRIRSVLAAGVYEIELGALEQMQLNTLPNAIYIETSGPYRRVMVSFRNLLYPEGLGMNAFQRGVSIHYDQGYANKTVLARTLADGKQFFDAATGLKIIQLSHSAESAKVKIVLPTSEFVPELVEPVIAEHDLDGDGVQNERDCAAADPLQWTSEVAIDADRDGLRDSSTPVGGCYGDQIPEGFTSLSATLDSCVGTTLADTRDENWDGVSDSCVPGQKELIARYTQEACLRQALALFQVGGDRYGEKAMAARRNSLRAVLSLALTGPRKIRRLRGIRSDLQQELESNRLQSLLRKSRKLIENTFVEEAIPGSAPRIDKLASAPDSAQLSPCEIVDEHSKRRFR